jgi:hypothetical protein
MTPYGYTFGR